MKFNYFFMFLIFLSSQLNAQTKKPLTETHKDNEIPGVLNTESKKSLHDEIIENEFGDPPPFQWVNKFESYGSSIINACVEGINGDIYYCGYFGGQISFNSDDFQCNGFYDGYIAKTDQTGNQIWANTLSGHNGGAVSCLDMKVDDADNVYVTGHFENDTLWAGDQFTKKIGFNDLFLLKLNSSGDVLFLNSYGTQDGTHVGNELHIDSQGNVFVLDDFGRFMLKFSEDGTLLDEFFIDSKYLSDFCIANDTLYIFGTGAYLQEGVDFIVPYNDNPFIFRSDVDFDVIDIEAFEAYGFTKASSIVYSPIADAIYLSGFTYDSIYASPFMIRSNSAYYDYFILKWEEDLGITDYLNPELLISGEFPEDMAYNYFYDLSIMPDGSLLGLGYHSGSLPIGNDYFIPELGYFIAHWTSDLVAGDYHERLTRVYHAIPLNNDSILFTERDDGCGQMNILKLNGQESEFCTLQTKAGFSYASGLCSDDQSNIYLLAYSSEENDIASGKKDLFVSKLNLEGEVIWTLDIPGAERPVGRGNLIRLDKSGNIFGTGTLNASLFTGEETWVNEGNTDPVFFKLNPQGELEWIKRIETTINIVEIDCISTDSSGNIILSGNFSAGNLSYGDLSVSSVSPQDLFMLKLDTNGDPIWLKKYGGEGNEFTGLTAVDPQDNIYFTGEFTSRELVMGGVAYHLTEEDGNTLLLKLDKDGNILWLKDYGSGERGNSWPTSFNLSTDGNIFISGWMGRYNEFDDFVLTGDYMYNLFTMKLDGDGKVIWANNILNQQSYEWSSFNIGVDKQGNCYLGGSYRYGLNFGDHTLAGSPSGQDKNLFLVKYDENGYKEWIKDEIVIKPNLRSSIYNYLDPLCVLDEDKVVIGGRLYYGVQFDDITVKGGDLRFGFIGLVADNTIPVENLKYKDEQLPVFIYPNPASNFIRYKVPEASGGQYDLDIFSLTGVRLISKKKIASGMNSLDISNLEHGVYIVVISGDNFRQENKLIRE